MSAIRIARLAATETDRARTLFQLMGEVFETPAGPVTDSYLHRLLARADFWALEATFDGQCAGGLTAFTLPLTREEKSEIFLYDLAVSPRYQRRGIGRELVKALQGLAAAESVEVIFVPADNEDLHALDFYRAIGGEASPVTFFTFGGRD